MRKYDQHKINKNTPNNPALHRENETQLEELIRLRQQQDKGIYNTPVIPPSMTSLPIVPSSMITSQTLNKDPSVTYYALSG